MTRTAATTQNSAGADVRGDALVVAGALQREAVAALWSALPTSLGSLRSIDLAAVTALDTAGLAWLVEVVVRARRSGAPTPRISNAPAGYASLCMAYRIQPSLEAIADVAA
ncbi:MAG: anti-sigma B factor antagonist [Lysobacteraceae bacterium]